MILFGIKISYFKPVLETLNNSHLRIVSLVEKINIVVSRLRVFTCIYVSKPKQCLRIKRIFANVEFISLQTGCNLTTWSNLPKTSRMDLYHDWIIEFVSSWLV